MYEIDYYTFQQSLCDVGYGMRLTIFFKMCKVDYILPSTKIYMMKEGV